MARLAPEQLAGLGDKVRVPAYDLNATECGIVHLGPGAFHRAHQAVYTDLAMQFGGNWRITGVSMRSRDLYEKLTPQQGLYTLAVLDEHPYLQVIASIKDVLVLDMHRERVMAVMASPSTHIISMTVTEKGYCLKPDGSLDEQHADVVHDLANPDAPVSVVGLLTAALAARFASRDSQLTIISCDNLSDNGDKLGAAVVRFAALRDAELSAWIAANICFPNTMVDSITPATDEALITRVNAELGVDDAWPIQRESFTQWVVEDKFSGPRPDWHKVGVTFTDDVHIFEKTKLRVLNGTHSTLAYLGTKFGIETVFDAISDEGIETFIRRLLDKEILPSIGSSLELDLAEYADAIIQRYKNPHIRHFLAQIAWDGSQKLPFRILNTVRDNLAAGRDISCLCVSIAAWVLFIQRKGADQTKLTDPLAPVLLALAAEHGSDTVSLANAMLDLHSVFAELSDNALFRATVLTQLATLSREGASLRQILGEL